MVEQLSYAHGTTQTPLIGACIGDAWAATVAAHPGREALVSVHQDVRWTYRELDTEVIRLSRALLASSIQPGDRVGIWSPNCAEWVVTQLAAARVGAILVNVNPSYRRSELEYVLNQSGTKLLFHAPSFRGIDYGDVLAGARAPELREAIDIGRDWRGFLDRADDVSADEVARRASGLSFDDPINIQYTSGTTGFPKGATLSHHNILNNGFFIGEILAYTEQDRICIPVPFYHCFGMVIGTLASVTHGSCIVLPAEAFDARAALAAVATERCTSLYGVPTMFIAELDHPDFSSFDLTSLRTGVMAGAPCPVEVMRRVKADMHMQEVTICYGMTETSPVSTQTCRDAPLEKQVGTVGTVHPHVEVQIVDLQTGRTVPRGTTGELLTRGYSVMLGYWEDEDATRRAIDAGRWMHTGDLAVMDDDGYVNIVGRSKDVIIRGGENVYPREVEEFLYTHPAVADAQVVGVPDERLGEVVCAWIRLRDGADADEDEIRTFCKANVARSKVPTYIRFVEEFPMTVTGKIQKYRMREIEIEERGLHRAAATRTA